MTYIETLKDIKTEYPEFKSFLFNYEHRLLAEQTGHKWDSIICSTKSHFSFIDEEDTSVCYVHRIDDLKESCFTNKNFDREKAIVYID